MLEQLMRISNLFFIVNTIFTCIPQISAVTPITSAVPLAFIIAAALFRELSEDIRRYIDDIKADLVKYTLIDRHVNRDVKASYLLPGDCILLQQGQRCPADLLPIHSDSFEPILIQTAEIDGETTPKEIFMPKRLHQLSKEELLDSNITITSDVPNQRFDDFRCVVNVNDSKIGCDTTSLICQGSVLRSSDIICCVIYTGDFTKLALNRKKRRMRLSGTDKQMNKFVAFVFAIVLGISVFCSMMATIMFYTHTDHWYLDFGTSSASISIKEFFSYFTLSSYLIPIACAVCLELAKTMQSLFMKWDSDFKYETPNGTKGLVVRCAAMNDELGFVEYILADKTGTLTENEMNFVECIIDDISFKANELGDSVKPKEFSSPSSSPTPSNKEKVIDFLHCMALCHNATVTDGQFKSPSPDEEALLKAAALNGVKFKHRLQASLVIEHPDEETVQLLAFFPFSSERARSSVLVKIGERIVLYSKGADHIMNSLVIDGEYCDVKPLAERGLRTLVLCKREITDEFYANWSTTWENAQGQLEGREVAMKNAIEEMEKELTVLGCTGVEDRLQSGVKETLQMFVDGGIRVWVITGDKEETGVAVGNACGLLKDCELSYINEKTSSGCLQSLGNAKNRMENNKGKHALVITASAIDICVEDCKELFKEVATEADVVMCCRSMPLQKAKIAKHVREITKKKCLAIGDGANDIPMINAASVGVGIYGKEGSQAARSADYSLYRFSHLGKLVMYHGRLSLYRNTSLIKLIFFKNAAFFLHLLWFACICMFTSQRVYDDYMMALYNFIFTSIPPVFISFFDSDLTWEQIKEHPQVNRELIRTKRGNILSYLGWFGYGTYQSIIYFYLMIMFSSNDVLTLDGKISGMVGASAIVTTYTTLGVIITFALIVKRWNGAIIFGFCVSIISFFFTYVFLTSFSGATRENLSYFAFWRALKMPGFYLYSIFAIIVAIFPCLLKI